MSDTEKKIKIKRTVQQVTRTSAPVSGIRHFGAPLPTSDIAKLRQELDDMTEVLMGRVDPPIPPENIGSLMEVANAYYSRGMEIAGRIQRMEAQGVVLKNSEMYRFRTGELRTFNDMAKAACELGSRRITVAAMEADERYG